MPDATLIGGNCNFLNKFVNMQGVPGLNLDISLVSLEIKHFNCLYTDLVLHILIIVYSNVLINLH